MCSYDICPRARDVYARNFGIQPVEDVQELTDLPCHDILCAGFPCQSFSMIGHEKGLQDDERGALIWETIRLAEASKPPCILLENVRRLATLDGGSALRAILARLQKMWYTTVVRILNAMQYGFLSDARGLHCSIPFKDAAAVPMARAEARRPLPPSEPLLTSDTMRHNTLEILHSLDANQGRPSESRLITDKGNRATDICADAASRSVLQ